MFARYRVAPVFASAQVARAYVIRRRWDYFVQHLMGATPPDNYEITRPPDAAGGPGGGAPDDDPSSWREP